MEQQVQEDTHSLDTATANYRQVYLFGHMAGIESDHSVITLMGNH